MLQPLSASTAPAAPLLAGGELTRVDDDSWLVYRAAWRDGEQALLEQLRVSLAWERRDVVLFGRRHLQPRMISWAGTLPYRYSGQTLPARHCPDALLPVLRAVQDQVQVPFNHVLLNYYRDGRDSMGWHADDEPELGPLPVIASLSLGSPRDFRIKPKREHEHAAPACYAYRLGRGALLVMGGNLQHRYLHALPKRQRESRARLNLTFRYLRFPPREPR